ncbi:MAG TPA: serine hydrolase domain-containing protein [Candidatus Acidoferrum sp.]
MAKSMCRSLYRLLLKLHPPAFRERFAEEMLWIFDEAAATQGVPRLFADAFVSLMRQWVVRPESWHTPLAAVARPVSGVSSGFFNWRPFEEAESGLPFYRWMQGGVISLGMLSVVWLMAGVRGRVPNLPNDSMAMRSSKAAWALPSQSSPGFSGEMAVNGPDGGGYGTSGTAEDVRARQLRQQEQAVQVAIAGRSVPGSPRYVTDIRTATVDTPKTPAGEQFSAWLAALNSGDRAKMEEILGHFKDRGEREVNGMMGFRQRTGGFDLKKIEETSPLRISGLLQERDSDQFARFTMDVEAEAPHKITRFDLNAIPRPVEFPVERMSQSELLAALRDKLEKDSAADKFAGAVIVAKDRKVIFKGAYGLADREKKIPNTLETKFRIGSMNKMFTATSILQLVQAGKIALTDPTEKYITDYPNKEVASKVTIQQLLTHTGGTGDIFGPEFEAHRKDLKTLQDYVNLYGKRGLEFEPGSRWEYSNYGFLLLGLVVERVSGKSYYDYVSENVYGPAGMTASGSLTEDQMVANRSIGYTHFGGSGLQPNTDTLPYRGTSAGGGYSTVEDLLKFANAVTYHKVLDAKNTELLTTGKVNTERGVKYAFGFMDDDTDATMRHFGHGGGAPGMNGDLEIYPQSGYVIAVLSNLDPPAASRISDFVCNRLPKN